jgi:hypothetical protein
VLLLPRDADQVFQPTLQTRQSGETGFMGSRDMGGLDWVTFLARSFEGRVNRTEDSRPDALSDVDIKGEG